LRAFISDTARTFGTAGQIWNTATVDTAYIGKQTYQYPFIPGIYYFHTSLFTITSLQREFVSQF